MNIGIVTTWFERGAAYVSRQYRDILRTKHNVYIYARAGEAYAQGDDRWDDCYVTWGARCRRSSSTSIVRRDFLNWIKKKKIDVVFFNEQRCWDPILWCKDLNIKIGAYIDYYTEETIPLFAAYDFLICNTRRHLSAFDWHPQAFFIPWGTDVELFSPISSQPVEDGFVTFFHSAGMDPYRKGTDLVVKAFTKIKGNARLIIHTQKSLKSCLPELKDVISSLERDGSLALYEKTVPAPGLYKLGDVYVYPSNLEGIGLTIAEALSCGLPVITSDNAPMNELINETNGKLVKISRLYSRFDGYYWPQCSVELSSLITEMQYYLDQVHATQKLKQKAREYASKNLDWFKNSENILEIFENAQQIPFSQQEETKQKILSFQWRKGDFLMKLNRKFQSFLKIKN